MCIRDSTISVSVDLNGETRVVNHPISITFSTLQTLDSGQQIDILRSFTTTQTTALWQDYTIIVEARSSVLTSFGDAELLETDSISFSHSRYPWGEVIKLESTSTGLDEGFTVIIQPNDNLLFGPMPLTIITLVVLFIGLSFSLSITKNKHRRFLMLELVLLPIAALVYIFAYPPLFVFGASGSASVLWILTAIVSPRRLQAVDDTNEPEPTVSVPSVSCPSCSTSIPVLSDERPLRIACHGCGKTIKIVG